MHTICLGFLNIFCTLFVCAIRLYNKNDVQQPYIVSSACGSHGNLSTSSTMIFLPSCFATCLLVILTLSNSVAIDRCLIRGLQKQMKYSAFFRRFLEWKYYSQSYCTVCVIKWKAVRIIDLEPSANSGKKYKTILSVPGQHPRIYKHVKPI